MSIQDLQMIETASIAIVKNVRGANDALAPRSFFALTKAKAMAMLTATGGALLTGNYFLYRLLEVVKTHGNTGVDAEIPDGSKTFLFAGSVIVSIIGWIVQAVHTGERWEHYPNAQKKPEGPLVDFLAENRRRIRDLDASIIRHNRQVTSLRISSNNEGEDGPKMLEASAKSCEVLRTMLQTERDSILAEIKAAT